MLRFTDPQSAKRIQNMLASSASKQLLAASFVNGISSAA
jgi:hypothetical protein